VDKSNCASKQAGVSPTVRDVKEYFAAYEHVLANLPYPEIVKAIAEIMAAYGRGSSIFTFGNGGSASLASHLACDLGKGTIIGHNGHKRFRVLALTDNIPLMTAWANDVCYEQVFSQKLQNFVVPGYLAFAISGSGNSPNVLRGLELAREEGARTLGLTGFKGGEMKALCDVCVVLPSDNMQIIEDLHLSVTHAISSAIRQKVFKGLQVQQLAATSIGD
jgi:D-sedoheptulose 7-phosphate isomerase